MMICDADFDDLFPDIFRPEQPAALPREQPAPGAVRIAPLEGDGGLTLAPLQRPDVPTGPRATLDDRLPDPLTDGMMAAMLPAAAAAGSLWAGLAAYVEMTRDLRNDRRAA